MGISAKQVKALRDATGAGMMDCKKALEACGGDQEAAKLWLQKKGIADSKKRAGRVASQGTIVARHDDHGRHALLLEVNCETDFVARNPDFQAFAEELAELALTRDAPSTSALLELEWDGRPVAERVLEQSGKTGEKLVVRRLDWVRIPEGALGRVGSYVHDGGKIGVVVAATANRQDDLGNEAFVELLKDLAMHITASEPLVVSSEDLDPSEVAKQQEILSAQAAESGKPAKIVEKMVLGRLNKWKKGISLLDQPFVKNPEVNVGKHIATVAQQAQLAAPARVVGFVRYRLGEGVED